MGASHRFAICNELFQTLPFPQACKEVRALGYEGLEIAPFTLGEDPTLFSAEKRAELRRVIVDEGLTFVGLHWLLVSPAGLHATSADEAKRKRTWDFIHGLIDLCADLAGCQSENNGLMVFGSPQQRSAAGGMTPREAIDVFTHELAHAAPHAESCGVKILVEALPANQSNVVNTLAEAVSIVKQIGSPAIQTMFDTHNAINEREPHASLVRRYLPYIRHVHLNEMDGREPGTGEYDFHSLLSTFGNLNYQGWFSLEVFDFSRNPQVVGRRAISHLTSEKVLSQTV